MVYDRNKRTQKSTTPKKKGKWLQIGTLRDPDQVLVFNENAEKEAKSPYLVINKDIEIFFKGEPVDLGEFRIVKLSDPFGKIERLLEGGYITEDQAESDKKFIDEKNVLFNLNIPPQE